MPNTQQENRSSHAGEPDVAQKKIIACVDSSPYAPCVAEYGAWVAQQLASPLELLHVIDREQYVSEGRDHSGTIGVNARENLLERLSQADENRSREARETARAFITGLRRRLQEQHPDLVIDTRLRLDNLATTLSEHESQAQLFVLGRRGSGSSDAAGTDSSKDSSTAQNSSLGRQLEGTVRALRRPVLAVGSHFSVPESALIACDGSAMSRKAVQTVAAGKLFAGLHIHLLHAGSTSRAAHLEEAQQKLEQAGYTVTTRTVDASPVEAITGYITQKQIDLLLMGAYSHSPWRSLFVGSTTTDVLKAVSQPVLLLRT